GDGDVGEIVARRRGEQLGLADAEPGELAGEPRRFDGNDLGKGTAARQIDSGGAVGGEEEGAAAARQLREVVMNAGEDDMAAAPASVAQPRLAADALPQHEGGDADEQNAGGAGAEPERQRAGGIGGKARLA